MMAKSVKLSRRPRASMIQPQTGLHDGVGDLEGGDDVGVFLSGETQRLFELGTENGEGIPGNVIGDGAEADQADDPPA